MYELNVVFQSFQLCPWDCLHSCAKPKREAGYDYVDFLVIGKLS